MDAKTILIVEDDPKSLHSIKQALKTKSKVFDLIEAHSPQEALDTLEHERADLVLISLQLPNAHAQEFLTELHGWEPNLPVVVLKAHSKKHTDDLSKDWNRDASAVLAKPVKKETLTRTLCQIFDGGGEALAF